jgi:hypothetical protein
MEYIFPGEKMIHFYQSHELDFFFWVLEKIAALQDEADCDSSLSVNLPTR